MKTKLLLCLIAGFATANAATYVGDQNFSAPFHLNEPLSIAGNLTFVTPGTYSAASWNITGVVRFAAAGEYTFIAAEGGVTAAGAVLGPLSGRATVYVSYRTTIQVVGTLPPSVVMVDDGQRGLPPSTEPPAAPPPAPLMNLSVRATLAPGATVIPAFVVGGTAPRRVLVRAIGPGLTTFGVTGVLADPTLTVFSGSLSVGLNDNWSDGASMNAMFAAVGAFGLQSGSRDAAVVLTLQPGPYTIKVRGAGPNDAGEVLVEVYFVE